MNNGERHKREVFSYIFFPISFLININISIMMQNNLVTILF